ncbi:MAG: hypothetical protein Q4B60_01555 [Erysipelotrichaceae bacterium]|nr:hypothetical protein [Erysipelotrichaceae bacterium]
MSAIAYITDSKMLELHRLNANKTMNFWRLSLNTSFSDFGIGDLVFFLSKDKIYLNKKEKGIVGYGKLKNFYTASPKKMWKDFKTENGYNTYEEFSEAIIKVSKGYELPQKISSLYLGDVTFFQHPIYLSECGVNISNNVESYIYIKPENTVIKLLEFAKNNIDIWSSSENQVDIIDTQQLECAIKIAFSNIGDYIKNSKELNSAYRKMKKLQANNEACTFIGKSKLNLMLVNERDVLIVLYNNKNIDKRILLGQCELYKRYIGRNYPNAYKLYFKTSNGDKETDKLLNKS